MAKGDRFTTGRVMYGNTMVITGWDEKGYPITQPRDQIILETQRVLAARSDVLMQKLEHIEALLTKLVEKGA